MSQALVSTLMEEVLRDFHRYVPGLGQRHPTLLDDRVVPPQGRVHAGVDRGRDLFERAAARAGFVRRHLDPEIAARQLARVMELSEGLEATYDRLADEASRRRLIDILKLRVLGPVHAQLAISPEAYQSKQAIADERLCREARTFEVSNPWFSPLSLYELPADGPEPIRLHTHSVEVVSVFLLTILALAIFIVNDAVHWPMGLALAAGNTIGSLIGVRLAVRKGHRWLKGVVTVTVIAFAIKLWWDA